ncbi:DUF2321 domain-containing protein [Micromonospora sp. BQ11]|uniref:DUF2321 domain-containing protein n=1 Tax=Micromonospora sp. BQ11 TaxID=3452212 RepID=UPI003F8A4AAA
MDTQGFWRGGGPSNDDYRAASVCRRGHAHSSNLSEPLADPGRCPECGADILTACRHCGLRIRGTSRSRVLRPGISLSPDYSPPSFCDGCGDPHPWASRQARIFQLENLLDEEDIDEAARLVVTEHLRQLQELTPDDDPEREQGLWKSVSRHAPGLFAGAGKQILTSVIDLTTRRAIGMDS